MLPRQTGDGYTGFTGQLRQAALEIEGMVGPPLAGRHSGFIGQIGSRYIFDGNYFGSSEVERPEGHAWTLTFKALL